MQRVLALGETARPRMLATCAICLRPLRNQQDVRILGTEVVHRECARSGVPTRLTRMQTDLAQTQAQLAEQQRLVAETSVDLARARRQCQNYADSVREVVDNENRLGLQLALVETRMEQVSQERDQARQEAATARAELEDERRRNREHVPAAEPSDTVQDATSVRFSLLEF